MEIFWGDRLSARLWLGFGSAENYDMVLESGEAMVAENRMKADDECSSFGADGKHWHQVQ